MASIAETGQAFFEACDSGRGWEACAPYCHPDASFAAQVEPLVEVRTLQAYTEWMRGLLTFIPDGRYTMQALGIDAQRGSVMAYATFRGMHSGEGGPVPPTGMSTSTDYVYVMEFEDGKIRHMTKIWNAGWAMRELGWTT